MIYLLLLEEIISLDFVHKLHFFKANDSNFLSLYNFIDIIESLKLNVHYKIAIYCLMKCNKQTQYLKRQLFLLSSITFLYDSNITFIIEIIVSKKTHQVYREILIFFLSNLGQCTEE